jgi:hypothetical protein
MLFPGIWVSPRAYSNLFIGIWVTKMVFFWL